MSTGGQLQPPEPVYSLADAAKLLAFPTSHALKTWLWRNKADYKPIYRQSGLRMKRYITLSDLLRMRAKIFRGERRSGKRPPANPLFRHDS